MLSVGVAMNSATFAEASRLEARFGQSGRDAAADEAGTPRP